MVSAPIIDTALGRMPQDRAGAAAAVISTSRQIGVAKGIALCAEVAGSTLPVGDSDFTETSDHLWWLGIAVGIAVTGLAISSTSARAVRTAQRLSPLLESGPAEVQ